MSATVLTSVSPTRPAACIENHVKQRQQQATGWLPLQSRQLLGGQPTQQATQSRRLSVRPQVLSGAAADLATYHFAQRHAGTTSEWFQAAVRDIVKHVDEAPMLQTVQLGRRGDAPRCSTYSVHESVVAVPELWQGIAEHVSQHSPDVVILVQKVSTNMADGSPQGSMDAAMSADWQQQQWASTTDGSPGSSAPSSPRGSPPGSPCQRCAGSHEMRVQAEEACHRLVSSGMADAILLHGQVGDCCDGKGGHGASRHHCHDGAAPPSAVAVAAAAAEPGRQLPMPRPLPLPSIVSFSPSGVVARRGAVRAAALWPLGPDNGRHSACQQSTCYWGVVVQGRKHTGAEGCYLLKTVKNTSAATGCTCTHFSLTRISHGDHLEQQFVQSWLL